MTNRTYHRASSQASVWLPMPTGDINEDWGFLLGFLKSAFQKVFVTRYDRYSDTLSPPDFEFDLLVQLLAVRNLDLFTFMDRIAAERGVPMTNPAQASRICVDKRNLPVLFPEFVPETRVVRDISDVEICFHDWDGDIIVKPPFYGMGESIIRINSPDALGEAAEVLEISPSRDIVVQPFCEGFSQGDQRVLLTRSTSGEPMILGNFGRIPKPGGWMTNITQGASFFFRPLESDERALALEVFHRTGLDYAGLDIGRHDGRAFLIEVNPTGGGLIDCDVKYQTNTQTVLFDLLQSRLDGAL
ncbi:MAG: hypothetical protein AAGG56_14250 [Pseudomonadota bacterium]